MTHPLDDAIRQATRGLSGWDMSAIRTSLSAFVQELAAQPSIVPVLLTQQQTQTVFATRVVPEQSPPISFTLKKRRKRQTLKGFPFLLSTDLPAPWFRDLRDRLHATLTADLGPEGALWIQRGGNIYFHKRDHAVALTLLYRGVRLDTVV